MLNNCKIAFLCIVLGSILNSWALIPNPIISRGKPVYTSSGSMPSLVDNKFKGTTFKVSNNSWVAINIGAGYSKVFFSWRDPDSAWALTIGACHHGYNIITEYDVLKSSNSTNGSDGTWTKVDSVRGNLVTTRGHLFDLAGSTWIKMNIIKGGSTLDEIEVFDASKGAEDIWCFAGTSITQMAYKDNPPPKNYADLVNASHPKYNPAMIMAGIGCITSGDMVANLHSTYLPSARNAHFWAIEMGANDVFRGVTTAAFAKNLSIIIDSCLAAGIKPVISRTPFLVLAKSKYEVPTSYLTAIDSLTKAYKLVAGPDFYSYFQTNPGELKSDGTHPNSTGCASIQRLWAEKMSALYNDSNTAIVNPVQQSDNIHAAHSLLSIKAGKGVAVLYSACAGTAFVYTMNGQLVDKMSLTSTSSASIARNGLFLVKFVSQKGTELVPVMGL